MVRWQPYESLERGDSLHPTLLAILQALRALYMLMLFTGVFLFLFAGHETTSRRAGDPPDGRGYLSAGRRVVTPG